MVHSILIMCYDTFPMSRADTPRPLSEIDARSAALTVIIDKYKFEYRRADYNMEHAAVCRFIFLICTLTHRPGRNIVTM